MARMGPVRGRRDEMLIVRGVNLYPSEVEHTLLHVEGVAPHYQLVLERPDDLDELTVRCEPVDAGVDREALRARVARALREHTGIHVAVELVAPGEGPRTRARRCGWSTAPALTPFRILSGGLATRFVARPRSRA